MLDETTEITGDATPVASADSAPADPGGMSGEAELPQASQAAEPAPEGETQNDDTAWPEDHSDIKGLEGHRLHPIVVSQRSHLKELKSSLREREQQEQEWKAVRERIGDAAAVLKLHDRYSGLRAPVLDKDTQQPVLDPETQLPTYTPEPFVKQLHAERPLAFRELLYQALEQPLHSADGTYADEVLEALLRKSGASSTELQQWLAAGKPLAQPEPPAPAGLSPEVLAEEARIIEEHFGPFGDAYKNVLTDRQRDLLWDESVSKDEKLKILGQAKAQQDLAERDKAKVEADQAVARQAQQAEYEAIVNFNQGLQATTRQNLKQVTGDILGQLGKSISKVRVSANEADNEYYQSMALASLAALVDPDTRQAGMGMLKGLGITELPKAFDDSLKSLYTNMSSYTEFAELEKTQVKKLALYRDSAARDEAAERIKSARLDLLAQFNVLIDKMAAKHSEIFGQFDSAVTAQLAQSQSRPVVRGEPGGEGQRKPVRTSDDLARAFSEIRQG